jgi:hypothetical protein
LPVDFDFSRALTVRNPTFSVRIRGSGTDPYPTVRYRWSNVVCHRSTVVMTRASRDTCVLLLLGVLLSNSSNLAAQVQRYSVEEYREAMRQFDWMIGTWEGSGWIEIAGQGRQAIVVTQEVSSKVNGLFLVVDTVEVSQENGNVVHSGLRIISGEPPAVLPGPPGTYLWQELSTNGLMVLNEAQASANSLQVGLPFSREDCDRILDDSWRQFCRRGGEPIWSRRTISLNDNNEWVETREWQRNESLDVRPYIPYFRVVLRRVDSDD